MYKVSIDKEAKRAETSGWRQASGNKKVEAEKGRQMNLASLNC